MKMNEVKSGGSPVRWDDGREKRPSCERQWKSQPSDRHTNWRLNIQVTVPHITDVKICKKKM